MRDTVSVRLVITVTNSWRKQLKGEGFVLEQCLGGFSLKPAVSVALGTVKGGCDRGLW